MEIVTNLELLLERIGLPMKLTTENLKWLCNNLPKDHPDFPETIHLVATLLELRKEKYERPLG